MKKRLLFLVFILVMTISGIMLFAGCSNTFKPGDAEVDVEKGDFYPGIGVVYPGKQINVKYITDDGGYVTLEGYKENEMKLTGAKGTVKNINLADIENKVKVGIKNISVTEIQSNAFANNMTLETVDLTKKDKSLDFTIGNEAFRNCPNLKSVVLPTNVFNKKAVIGSYAFINCPKLETVTGLDKFGVIGDNAFKNCLSLKSIILPTDMETIPVSMFENCEKLESVILPTTLVRISSNAFNNCALKDVDFSNSTKLVYIDQYAFNNNEMTKLALPDSVEQVQAYAFTNNKFVSIDVPFASDRLVGGNTSFFKLYGIDQNYNEELLPEVSVNVRKSLGVSSNIFRMDPSYTSSYTMLIKDISINILDDGKYPVYDFTNKIYNEKELTSSKTIPSYAFQNNIALEKVNISNITTINSDAFSMCLNLNDAMSLFTDKLESVSSTAFEDALNMPYEKVSGNLIYQNWLMKAVSKSNSLIIPEGVVGVAQGAVTSSPSTYKIYAFNEVKGLNDGQYIVCNLTDNTYLYNNGMLFNIENTDAKLVAVDHGMNIYVVPENTTTEKKVTIDYYVFMKKETVVLPNTSMIVPGFSGVTLIKDSTYQPGIRQVALYIDTNPVVPSAPTGDDGIIVDPQHKIPEINKGIIWYKDASYTKKCEFPYYDNSVIPGGTVNLYGKTVSTTIESTDVPFDELTGTLTFENNTDKDFVDYSFTVKADKDTTFDYAFDMELNISNIETSLYFDGTSTSAQLLVIYDKLGLDLPMDSSTDNVVTLHIAKGDRIVLKLLDIPYTSDKGLSMG